MKTVDDVKELLDRVERKQCVMMDAYRKGQLLEDEIRDYNYLRCAIDKCCETLLAVLD